MLNFISLPTCHVVEDVSLYGSLLTTVSCHLQQITWGITSLVISQDPCPYISSSDFLLCPLLFQAKLHLPVTHPPLTLVLWPRNFIWCLLYVLITSLLGPTCVTTTIFFLHWIQGILNSLFQHHKPTPSILFSLVLDMVQVSQLYTNHIVLKFFPMSGNQPLTENWYHPSIYWSFPFSRCITGRVRGGGRSPRWMTWSSSPRSLNLPLLRT